MIAKIRKINDSLPELLFGEIVFSLICGTVVAIFFDNKVYNVLGIVFGFAVSVFWAVNMAYGLGKAVDNDESTAVKLMQKGTALRYGIALVVLGVLMVTGFGNPLTAFLSMIGLKISAYASPLTHKLFRR